MASERGGVSSCFAAHLSIAARNSCDSLMAVTGSRPVAGRPPLFRFGSTVLDFDMFWYYHRSRPRGSLRAELPLGPHPAPRTMKVESKGRGASVPRLRARRFTSAGRGKRKPADSTRRIFLLLLSGAVSC